VQEIKSGPYALKLDFKEPVADINKLLRWLIDREVRIREVRSGLEALYMKIISSEEGRTA